MADEHLLLGVLRRATNPTATLLHTRGLDLQRPPGPASEGAMVSAAGR